MDWFTEGLVARGIPPHIAKAFALNGMDESGLDPGINEIAPLVPGSRGGFGLMQWTGPRRRALEAYAASLGRPVDDPQIQMDFLVSELHGDESRAWERIAAAQDTPTAAAAIVNYFLRPAEQHRARREREYLGGGGRLPPPSQGNALAAMPSPAVPQQNALAAMQPQQPEPWRPADNYLDPAMFMTARPFTYTPIG